jgi:hypothetical protein
MSSCVIKLFNYFTKKKTFLYNTIAADEKASAHKQYLIHLVALLVHLGRIQRVTRLLQRQHVAASRRTLLHQRLQRRVRTLAHQPRDDQETLRADENG